MNMRRYFTKIAAGAASAMILAAPFAAGAISVGDVQAQIEAILKQVAALQEQIRNLQGQNTVTRPPQEEGIWIPKHRVCSILNRNLVVGVSGEDVRSLQEFLQAEGHLSVPPTGYFGQLTAQAVAQWQAREGVTAGGSFGPISRERMKIWCGDEKPRPSQERFNASPVRGNSPLTVTFNTWLSGFRVNTVSYVIDYGDGSQENAANCPAPADACTGPGINTHTYTKDGSYTATLQKITDPCPDDGDPTTPRCMAAIRSDVVGKAHIQVGTIACTTEYMPVCGAKQIQCITTPCNPIPTTYGNKCEMRSNGASFLYEGQCRTTTSRPIDDPQCKVWQDACNSCTRSTPGGPGMCTQMACTSEGPAQRPIPYCKEYFGSSANKPPVISGISGPTTLIVNQTGTWSIQASDPEGQTLSYKIRWGDEDKYPMTSSQIGAARADSSVQSTTFTHTYSAVGIYTVMIEAKDTSGATTQSSVTVNVGTRGGCTAAYALVCGTKYESGLNYCPYGTGQVGGPCRKDYTYDNRCMLDADGATFVNEGECSSNTY